MSHKFYQRLDKLKITQNYIHSLPCISSLCGYNKLPQSWKFKTMRLCHLLCVSGSSSRPPSLCHSVTSAGFTSHSRLDVEFCPLQPQAPGPVPRSVTNTLAPSHTLHFPGLQGREGRVFGVQCNQDRMSDPSFISQAQRGAVWTAGEGSKVGRGAYWV